MNEIQCHAFTSTNQTLVRQLKTNVDVLYNDKSCNMIAQWDTGATNTSISHDVVRNLGLTPTGFIYVHTPSGKLKASTYSIDIVLPNKLKVHCSNAIESEIGEQGIGLLIGMDVILLGDFAISNFGNKTVFTFRMPSKQVTDYVKIVNAQNVIGKKHGTGNRKKK